MEHDPFARIAFGAAGLILLQLEHRLGDARRHRHGVAGALDPERRLHGQAVRGRQIVERSAALELLDQLGGFRLELLGDLIAAPALLDLGADLVERLLARRRDFEHLVPDKAAALQLCRLVLDADIRTERRRDDVGARRQAGDRIARRVEPLAVGRLDGGGLQAELLRHLGEAQPARALVLDLVAARGKLALGAVGCDLLLDRRHDLLERLDVRGLDLDHADQDGAEGALHRRAGFALFERERRCGDRLVDDAGLGLKAERDVFFGQAAFLGQRLERQLGPEPLRRGLGLVRVGKGNLLQVAPLGRAVAAQVAIIILASVRVADVVGLDDIGRRQRHHGDGAVFGRAELRLVVGEVFLQHLRRRRGDIAGLGAVERDVVDRALFVFIAIIGVRIGLRQRQLAADRLGDLAPQGQPLLLGGA